MKKILKGIKVFFRESFIRPIKLILHPVDGWNDFKFEKQGKSWVAVFYLVMMIIAAIMNKTMKGFLIGGYNSNKDFNLLKTILTVILPIFVGTLASWAIGSLLDGKGKMGEIFKAITYSLFPIVWLSIISTILSNFITSDETLYYTFIKGLGVVLTVWMLFFGIMGVHQNSFLINIIHIILSIVVIAVIIFVVLLFFSFIERVVGFIESIIDELRKRYF